VKLGLEDKKKAKWAVALGVVAVLAAAYEVVPMFMDPSAPSSSAQAAVPTTSTRLSSRLSTKPTKKVRVENLDPTLRLDLLKTIEQTQYQGNGKNIFVSAAEPVKIETAVAQANTDNQPKEIQYVAPQPPPAPPIPLKFYGFASQAGESKKIFLSLGEDVFVAGEGEIVDRRYKIVRISPTSVQIQDEVNSGPPQSIPLSQG
jgi:hypothetical protein